MENNTEWVYKVDDNNEEYFDDFLYLYVSYNDDDNEILYYSEYEFNLIGIDNLDNFFKFLENRNKNQILKIII